MAALTESNLRNSIKAILQGADLNTLSSKKVRKQLEDEYDTDLTDRKKEIDNILMEMITASQNETEKEKASNDEESDKSGASENEQSGSESEEEESNESSEKYSDSDDSDKPPPKKKQKTTKKSPKKFNERSATSSQSNDSEVDDEALARKLQEEEIKSRSRAVKKSSGNKRESKGGGSGTKQKKENSYTRKCLLSPALASVVGADKMARHDVVKKMWSLVKERNLLDPSNRQYAICDEQLQKVFGMKRFRMFGMMKYLKNHMTDLKQ